MENEINKLSKEEAKKLLLAFLVTDGSFYRRKDKNMVQIKLHGKDKCLHKLFIQTMKKAFDKKPVLYLYEDKRALLTVFEFSTRSDVVKELIKLSPSFKTKSIKNPPTIEPILKGSQRLKKLALRIGFSTEGCICLIKNKKPRLRFACSNPNLVYEWQRLIKEFEIDMHISKDRNVWSGIQGLNTDKRINMKKFLKLGGFIPGCLAYKSKIFPKQEKNLILEGINRKFNL